MQDSDIGDHKSQLGCRHLHITTIDCPRDTPLQRGHHSDLPAPRTRAAAEPGRAAAGPGATERARGEGASERTSERRGERANERGIERAGEGRASKRGASAGVSERAKGRARGRWARASEGASEEIARAKYAKYSII